MTKATMKLRPYQEECLAKIDEAIADGCMSPAVEMATGLGKTVCFGEDVRRKAEIGQRTLILVHRDELVWQARNKIEALAPGLHVGVMKGQEHNDPTGQAIIGSVQTLRNTARLDTLPQIDRVIIDECHHATAQSYRTVAEYLDAGSKVPLIGYTATMTRSDKSKLGDVWERLVFRRDTLWAIRNKHLTDVTGYSVVVDDLDLTGVRSSGGDYAEGQLGQAIVDSSAASQVVDAWRERAEDRPTVLFAPTIASAEMFLEAFLADGVTAEIITGSTSTRKGDPQGRTAIFERFRKGETRVIVNCMVLTEGWDEPCASCAIIARPTKSNGLYIQMAGRVLRPDRASGKTDAIILDVVGAASVNSLVSYPDLTRTKPTQTVKEGETLCQASERWAEEEVAFVDDVDPDPDFNLSLEPVDLFAGSKSAWKQTRGGTWFCGSSKRYFFIVADGEGTYNVRSTYNRSTVGNPPTLHGSGIPLDFAMGVADGLILDDDLVGTVSQKNASWRRGKVRPTVAQMNLARSRGILQVDPVTRRVVMNDEGYPVSRHTGNALTKSTLSDEIDIDIVSQMFRRYGL